MHARWILTVCAVLLGGCGGVFSTHPASDEATSRFDERLVGFWRVVEPAPQQGQADGPREETIFVLGRTSSAGPDLSVVTVTLHKDGTIETYRLDAKTTTLGRNDHASVRPTLDEEPTGEAPGWTILRYEMPDSDTVRVLGMDEQRVAADVRAGTIHGKIAEWTEGPEAAPKIAVTVDAPTSAIRAYLEARGDAVQRTDQPLVLRRWKRE